MFNVDIDTPIAALTVGQFQDLLKKNISYPTKIEITKPILNIREASELVGFSVNTLYKFTSQKSIPFFKRQSKVLFNRDELIKWMQANPVKTVEQTCNELDERLTKKRR